MYEDVQTALRGGVCKSCLAARALLQPEVLPDVPREMLVDFRVPGDGLLLSSERVEVHVVPAAVPEKHTLGLDQLPDQLRALHTAISFVR